jgi:hypothetical protein
VRLKILIKVFAIACSGLERWIESKDFRDRLKWLGVSLAFIVSYSLAQGIGDSMGFPEVTLGVLSTRGSHALRLGISLWNTASADPLSLMSALYIKTLLPDPRSCPSGLLGVGPATEAMEQSILVCWFFVVWR